MIQDALKYQKKTADVIKNTCSRENYAHKYQLSKFPVAANLLKWPSDSRKDDYYINEEGLNELVFTSQQPEAKAFRKYCCNELFPRVRKLLIYKMIEEKDMQLALLNDDLTIAKENVVALEQEAEVERLKTRAVPHLEEPRKDNGIVVIQKNNGDPYPYFGICGQQG